MVFVPHWPWLGSALGAIGVFVLSWLAASLLRRAFERLGSHLGADRAAAAAALGKSIYITLIGLGGLSALGTLGIDVSALIAGLGLTGFALGFALKDALANLLAGMLLLLYRPFGHGDTISVSGFTGIVTGIDLRYITLRTPEGKIVLLPNQTVFSNAIVLEKGVSPPEAH